MDGIKSHLTNNYFFLVNNSHSVVVAVQFVQKYSELHDVN